MHERGDEPSWVSVIVGLHRSRLYTMFVLVGATSIEASRAGDHTPVVADRPCATA